MNDTKYKKRIIIRRSNIKNAGLGVFANTFLKKGIILGHYKGRIYDAENLNEKELELLNKSAYVMAVYKDDEIISYIDSSDANKSLSNWTRYINGSKSKKQKPNVRFIQKVSRIHIETLRDIKKGEELIVDYGSDYIW